MIADDDAALIQRQLGQEWERETAARVIAGLLLRPTMRFIGASREQALQEAEQMLRDAEDDRVADEVKGQK